MEFKSEFPSQSHAIGKEMAALANTGGGVLLMGVTDDGAPIGIDNPDRVVERLAGIARSCGLTVAPEIDKFQISRNIFIVYAKIRPCPPCFYEGKIYHRVGSTSVECRSGEQLQNILASGLGDSSQSKASTTQPGNIHVARRTTARPRPWTKYWFVNVGEGSHRNWDDNRKYGYLSAGGGANYAQAIKRLRVGDKIFAYLSGVGYVGYGVIAKEAVMIKDFFAEQEGKNLLDLPLKATKAGAHADDPSLCEWAIKIDWMKTFGPEDAKYLKGVPVYRNVVCKLNHSETVSFLEREFEIERRNEDFDLVGLIDNVGKKVFVRHFKQFADVSLTNAEVANLLPSEYTLHSRTSRTSTARRIFRMGLERPALELISRAEKVDPETAKIARELLIQI